jgi:AraC-like DNA-binding protein
VSSGRRIAIREPGVLWIEQRILTRSGEIGTDVSGPACIYAHVSVARGRLTYLAGETEVRAPHTFAVFLPPFALVQAALDRCDVTSTAFAFRRPSAELPFQQPMLLAAVDQRPPESIREVEARLAHQVKAISVARGSGAAIRATSVKEAIDRSYQTPLGFDRIAAQLQTSPAQLSRHFKKAFGLPPVRYRHQVRIMAALMQFADGAAPADVFLDVGFEDLSRFYKMFRTIACAAPGTYRPSKNAKTPKRPV